MRGSISLSKTGEIETISVNSSVVYSDQDADSKLLSIGSLNALKQFCKAHPDVLITRIEDLFVSTDGRVATNDERLTYSIAQNKSTHLVLKRQNEKGGTSTMPLRFGKASEWKFSPIETKSGKKVLIATFETLGRSEDDAWASTQTYHITTNKG